MRVSSAQQSQEGDSIPAQREALRKYIDSRPDMICVGEYLDDGISGTKYDRDELQRMLADVENDNIDVILVTKMDRLHRSLRNFLNMQDILEKHHCTWMAIWEPMYDSSTPQGKMIINTMMNLAQFEAEQTGQRIRQVQAYKVSQGEVISGSTPPGMKIVGKRLVPDENADIVRQAFEHYSRYGNADATIRAFDHYGIFPQTKSAWKAILRNEKYIGKFRENEAFCEPIVDRELFADVQRKLSMNVKVSQKRVYIFSGLLRCAECGRVMGGLFRERKAGRKVDLKYYRCPGHYGAVRRCDNPKTITEHIFEKYLLERVRRDLEGIVLSAQAEEAKPVDNTARISALEKRLDRLKELYVNGLISLDEYKADRESMIKEISSLTAQEPQRGVDVDAIGKILAQPIESLYGGFTDSQRRYLWRSIIDRIEVDAEKNVRIFYLT